MNDFSSSKILIVDDTEANIDVLMEALGENYEISVATDGETALEAVAFESPDLILLDVIMPGIDGFETCRRLKENPETQKIPVIFITAKRETDDIVKGFQVGGVDYIPKPFQQDEVLARVRTHLQLEALKKQQEKLAQELKRSHQELLEYASLVQKGFLPQEPPQTPGFEFAAQTFPAIEVGGDFYDFIKVGENRLGLLLGDVSGKGVSAALFMARLVSDFRYLSLLDPNPASVMNRLNGLLCERAKKGMFATAINMLLDTQSKTLAFSNAGHHPLGIRDQNGEMALQKQVGGVPLGILPDTVYHSFEISLQPGQLVFLYTDGALEPVNDNKEHFGEARLFDLVTEFKGHPKNLVIDIKTEIDKFTRSSKQFDDLTVMAFNVL